MTSKRIAKRRGKGPRGISRVSEEISEGTAGAEPVRDVPAITGKESETTSYSDSPTATGPVSVDWDRVAELFADLILASVSVEDTEVPESTEEISNEIHPLLKTANSNTRPGE